MNIKRLFGSEKGSSIVMFTLFIVMMLGFAALVVDVGNIALHRAKAQHLVDSIALAVAQDLPDTTKAQATAIRYAELNELEPSKLQISFTNFNNSVEVKINEDVNYYFAKVFNANGTTVQSSAIAEKTCIGGALSYALFSGSTSIPLEVNGCKVDVTGDIHSNNDFLVNGSHLNISGAAEAVKSVTTNGNFICIGSRLPNSPYVEMPDFSAMIKQQAQEAGNVIRGDKTYLGSNIDVNTSTYIDGAVTFNGSRFMGKGCILAKGTVTFNGSNMYASTDQDAVCIYSETGDIIVNGSSAEVHGILYAPHGSIIFNGSKQTIRGRGIGEIVTFNGSGLTVISSNNDVLSLPSYGIKLTQ